MKKIFEKDHDDVFRRYWNYERTEDIAKDYNVNRWTISRVVKGMLIEKGIKPRKKRNTAKQSHMDDLVGAKFGKLEVLEILPPTLEHGKWEAKCICEQCGKDDFLIPPRELRVRKNETCGCVPWERKKGKNSPHFRGFEEISGSQFHQVERGAKFRGIEFDITIKYMWELFLKQNRRCALSGIELTFGRSNYDETTASLDRIDNSKGYIVGNVQWLDKDINKMKLHHSQEHFIELCKKVHENVVNEKTI